MLKVLNTLVFLGGLIGFSGVAVGAADVTLTDGQIAKVLRAANEGEVDAGKMAKGKTQNKQVEAFAQKMIDEHSANKDLGKKIAKKQDIGFKDSAQARTVQENADAKIADLKKLDGLLFDRAYIQAQIDLHQRLLDDLDHIYIPQAKDIAFKNYLQDTKSHVETHLAEAKQIQDTLK